MSIYVLNFDDLRDVFDNLHQFFYLIYFDDIDNFLLYKLSKLGINF